MKIVFIGGLLYLIFLTFSLGDPTKEATLSCPTVAQTIVIGPPGNPGKPGSKGDIGSGQKGDKGEIGQEYDASDKIYNLERNITETQRNLNNVFKERITELRRNMSTQLDHIKEALDRLENYHNNHRNINNCDDLYLSGRRFDGVYKVFIGGKLIDVYCEFQKDEQNWMVFQRRLNAEIDFYLNWTSYEDGFGDKTGEFWMGLKLLHELTSSRSYALRVDLEDWEDERSYAEYSSFLIGSPENNYTLFVTGYSGSAGDSLTWHNNVPFSTKDRNQYPNNCAAAHRGAWWYPEGSCIESNLNGNYFTQGPDKLSSIAWQRWRYNYSLKRASMKIRPN